MGPRYHEEQKQKHTSAQKEANKMAHKARREQSKDWEKHRDLEMAHFEKARMHQFYADAHTHKSPAMREAFKAKAKEYHEKLSGKSKDDLGKSSEKDDQQATPIKHTSETENYKFVSSLPDDGFRLHVQAINKPTGKVVGKAQFYKIYRKYLNEDENARIVEYPHHKNDLHVQMYCHAMEALGKEADPYHEDYRTQLYGVKSYQK
jgi:hypothetical protein